VSSGDGRVRSAKQRGFADRRTCSTTAHHFAASVCKKAELLPTKGNKPGNVAASYLT
jgi:hypothetical protein